MHVLRKSLFFCIIFLIFASRPGGADVGTAAFYGPPYLRKSPFSNLTSIYFLVLLIVKQENLLTSDCMLREWFEPVPAEQPVCCGWGGDMGQRRIMRARVPGEVPELCDTGCLHWWRLHDPGHNRRSGRWADEFGAVCSGDDFGPVWDCVRHGCQFVCCGDQHWVYRVWYSPSLGCCC